MPVSHPNSKSLCSSMCGYFEVNSIMNVWQCQTILLIVTVQLYTSFQKPRTHLYCHQLHSYSLCSLIKYSFPAYLMQSLFQSWRGDASCSPPTTVEQWTLVRLLLPFVLARMVLVRSKWSAQRIILFRAHQNQWPR